jgi:hypothetical protein
MDKMVNAVRIFFPMIRYLMTCLLGGLLVLFSSPELVLSGILLDDYKEGMSPNWEVRPLEGETLYQVTKEGSEYCIRATSRGSASALYYRIEYDTRVYPILKWRWKVSRVLSKGDALKREGDDYAARVFVVFFPGKFWKGNVLVYVWANRLPKATAVPSSHNPHFMVVAVESGSAHVGEWREAQRNVHEDYRRYFRAEPPKAEAIAIMTDTDNTGEEATAWYGPIWILPQSPR